MYAVQFEADIDNGLLRVPSMYKEIYQAHAKVTIMVDDTFQKVGNVDKSSLKKTSGILANLHIDPIIYQASCREDR
jgi:hypothetical protein